MNAETAFHLAMAYKSKAAAVVEDIRFWGQYLPPSHIDRLERIRSTFETMKSEMKRACANAVPDPRCDESQILHYVRVIESDFVA